MFVVRSSMSSKRVTRSKAQESEVSRLANIKFMPRSLGDGYLARHSTAARRLIRAGQIQVKQRIQEKKSNSKLRARPCSQPRQSTASKSSDKGKSKKLKETCPKCGKVRNGETVFESKEFTAGVCVKCYESERTASDSPRKPQKCSNCGEMTSAPVSRNSSLSTHILCPSCVGDPYKTEKSVPCVGCGKMTGAMEYEDPVECVFCTVKRRNAAPQASEQKIASKPQKQPKSKVVWCTKCKGPECRCPVSQPDDYICIECKGPADTDDDECFHCQAPWCDKCSRLVFGAYDMDLPRCPACRPKKKSLPSRWCKCGGVLREPDSLSCSVCRGENPKKPVVVEEEEEPKPAETCIECGGPNPAPWCSDCDRPWCHACEEKAQRAQGTSRPRCPKCQPKKPVVVEGRTPLLRSIKRDEAEGKEGEKVEMDDLEDMAEAKCKKCGTTKCIYANEECPQCHECGLIDCHCDECGGWTETCYCDLNEPGIYCKRCNFFARDWIDSPEGKVCAFGCPKREKSARMRTMKPSDRKKLDERVSQVRDLIVEIGIASLNLQTEWGLEQVAKLAQRVLDACNKKQ